MKKIFLSCCLICSFFLFSCEEEFGNIDKNEVIDATDEQMAYSERTCGTEDHQARLLSDPDYRAKFEKRKQKLEELASSRTSVPCVTPIILPIAVHFQSVSSPDLECLQTLAQTQIDILNADYQAQNTDVSLWDAVSSYYPGVEPSDACVVF